MIRKLHHAAYRCRDSEQTRRFYEDFLGLPLAGTLEIKETKSGRATDTLHTFYRLDDGSHIAFFEAPDMPFEFKPQHDYDLHIALEVEPQVLPKMLEKGRAEGIETREHASQLLALGCTTGQGYFFSKPIAVHETNELLRTMRGAAPRQTATAIITYSSRTPLRMTAPTIRGMRNRAARKTAAAPARPSSSPSAIAWPRDRARAGALAVVVGSRDPWAARSAPWTQWSPPSRRA